MKEYLTAKEAREMASKWQEVQIDFYIQRAIDAIKESANKGYYSKSFEAPPMNVSRKDCKKILEELGYTITGNGGSWSISWLETLEIVED